MASTMFANKNTAATRAAVRASVRAVVRGVTAWLVLDCDVLDCDVAGCAVLAWAVSDCAVPARGEVWLFMTAPHT